MVKLAGNRLKMTSGEIRKFKSAGARARFERIAKAIKHGFKPGKRKKTKSLFGGIA